MLFQVRQVSILAGVLFSLIGAGSALAGQPLETETARLPEQGHGSAQIVYEYQSSKVGTEAAVPMVFEYGISDRLEIAVEPVAWTSIRPKAGPRASGFGDTEVTLTWLVAPESGGRPAFALAGEIKFPTTKNPLIGTGGTDYRVFGILSKKVGRFDLHANLGFTAVGKSSGFSAGNIVDYALAAEYEASPHFSIVSEVLGTVAAGGSEAASGPGQEATGTSVTGLIGGVWRPTDTVDLAVGVTYDNNNATLVRTGITVHF